MATRHAPATRTAIADAVVDLVDAGTGAGTIKIYTGTVNATNGSVPAGTLLATVVLADPAFGAASGATATGTDPASVNAVATGTAGCFTLCDSDGGIVLDGTASMSGGGGDLILVNTSIVSGQPVDVTSLSYTAAA